MSLRAALGRFPLERALQLSIAVSIVTSVLAAGALLSWLDPARKARWVALGVLLVLALLAAGRSLAVRPLLVGAAASAFVAFAFASSLWSPQPGLTLERAAAFAAVLLTGTALASASAGKPATARRFLVAVLAGAAAVAVGGLLVLAFRHDRAVAAATTSLPARFQGLGGGPDTAAMVLSVGVPLAVWAFGEAQRRASKALSAVVFLLLLGSIVASGSRGALAAAWAGTLAYVGLAESGRRRLVAAAGVLAIFALALGISRIPQPASAGATQASLPSASHARPGYVDANGVLRLQDDIGHPPLGTVKTAGHPRTLFGTSGRAEAWEGALDQAASRPLAGFGFGTEDRVFVDRYVGFESNTVESSYIGLFLQLGAAGLALLLALLAAIGIAGLGDLDERDRGLAAASAGGLVAGLVLAFFQSYLYAPGNNATAAFWICAFMFARPRGPVVSPFAGRPARLATAVLAGLAVLAALVVVGRWERSRHADSENRGIARVLAAVGPLGSPSLSGYRVFEQFDCLTYRRGRIELALEICVEGNRVIEAIDRRSGSPKISSLREDRGRATNLVDAALVRRLLHRMGAL